MNIVKITKHAQSNPFMLTISIKCLLIKYFQLTRFYMIIWLKKIVVHDINDSKNVELIDKGNDPVELNASFSPGNN